MKDADLLKMFREAGKTRDIGLDVLLSLLDEDTLDRIVRHARVQATLAAAGIKSMSPLDELAVCVIAYMGWDQPESGDEDGSK